MIDIDRHRYNAFYADVHSVEHLMNKRDEPIIHVLKVLNSERAMFSTFNDNLMKKEPEKDCTTNFILA